MSRMLLTVGGIVNALFGLFHIFLGWQIQTAPGLQPNARSLLLALNVGGTLMIFFLAYASLLRQSDMLSTGLGRATQILAILLFWTRAAEELVLFSFTPVIFVSCLATGGIYVAVLLLGLRARSAEPATT
jgi:nicotinamide riboside transporter PnuC